MTASTSRMQALGRQTQPLSPNDGNLSVPLRVFASEHNRPAATVKTLVQKHFGDEGALIIDSEAYKHETESVRLHKAQDLLDFQTKEKGRSSVSAKKLRLERLSLRSKDENVRERILRSKAFSANVLANNLGSCNIPCPKVAPHGSKESVNPVIRTSVVDSDKYNNQLSDAFLPHATLSSWVLHHSHQAYASQNPPAASSMDSLSHLRIAKGNGSMQSALSKPSMGGQSSLKRVDGDFNSQQCSPTKGAEQHLDHVEVECMPCRSRSGSSDEASHEKGVSCSVSIDSSYSGSVSSEVNSHYAGRMYSRRGVYPKPSRESPESAKAATVMCASPDEGQQNKGVLLAAVTEHVSQEQEAINGGDGRGSRTLLGTGGNGARMRLLTHQSATMLCTSVEAEGNVESCAKSASKSARHNEALAETTIGESSGMQALIQRIEASVMLGDVRAREVHPTSVVKVVPLETSQYRKHQSAVGILKTTTADAHVRTSDLAHGRIGSTSSGVVGSAGRPHNGGR